MSELTNIASLEYLNGYDPEVGQAMTDELKRQRRNLELIASENLVSPAVMAAMGSHLTNKYAEGYPGKRYYGGCECVDVVGTGQTVAMNSISDYFIRNASFLKCSNITLGYSFPALLKYAGEDYFSGRVYFTVQNPFIITKYKGLDPEVANGVDTDPYPRPISFQLGVNFNF